MSSSWSTATTSRTPAAGEQQDGDADVDDVLGRGEQAVGTAALPLPSFGHGGHPRTAVHPRVRGAPSGPQALGCGETLIGSALRGHR